MFNGNYRCHLDIFVTNTNENLRGDDMKLSQKKNKKYYTQISLFAKLSNSRVGKSRLDRKCFGGASLVEVYY